MEINNLISFLSKKLKKTEKEIKEEIYKKIKEYNGLITEEGAIAIIAKENGIDITKFLLEKRFTISFLSEGIKGIEISVIVGKKFFESEKGIGFFVYDDTGRAKLFLWKDTKEFGKELKEGDIIKVKVDKVVEKGIIEIHVFSSKNVKYETRKEIIDLLKNIKEDHIFLSILGIVVKSKNLKKFYSFGGYLLDLGGKENELNENDIYLIRGLKKESKIEILECDKINKENLLKKMMNDVRSEE